MHSLCTSNTITYRPKSEMPPILTDCRVISPVVDPDPVGIGWIHPNPTLQSDTKINEPVKQHFTKIKFLGAVVSNIMTYVFQKQLMFSLKRF